MCSYTFFYRTCPGSDYKMFIVQRTTIDCMDKNDFDSLLSIICSNKDILQ